MMGGTCIFMGMGLIVFYCTNFITTLVTAGLTYMFVVLFDTMGDDWKKHEDRHKRR
jgi:hypothetical protein